MAPCPHHPPRPHNASWYIDGSLVDTRISQSCRLGFGVVVVGDGGQLLGLGNGRPPQWIIDAAGAELWAYLVALRQAIGVPKVVTDCRGFLTASRSRSASSFGRRRP